MMASGWMIDRPVPFAEGFRIQSILHERRLHDEIPDTVLFLEHTPVVTLGTRGRDEALLSDRENLTARGIDFEVATRGGDATYHAPGQLVMYPIVKLGQKGVDSGDYLQNLEEVAIRTCASFGVPAVRRDGMNGAWTHAGKIAAIGFRLKRWVSYHGMSFNVSGDLAGFKAIVPCGLVGERVCTLESHLGPGTPSLPEVREAMAGHFEDVCGRPLLRYDAEDKLPEAIDELIRIPKR